MGKSKNKRNWKARQVADTLIDKREEKKIKLDLKSLGGVEQSKYDDTNALVLPSKKRKTKIKKPQTQVTKVLSKKQRKYLEKIVQKKKNKEKRGEIFASLAQHEISSEERALYTPFSQIITKGVKKRFSEDDDKFLKSIDVDEFKALSGAPKDDHDFVMNAIKGSRKRKRLLAAMFPVKKKPRDLNVVGVEESSSEELSSDDEEVPIPDDEVAPSAAENVEPSKDTEETDVPMKPSVDSVKPQISAEVTSSSERKPATYVPVNRTQEIQESRLKLPILAEEQVVMETINENQVVVIAGETGSGKTTQVPQFLYEAGYASDGKMIGITEPRRVAAISMAKRVGEELNLGSNEVSYLIRFEGNVTADTKIKFMTDGVLLKEIQKDFLLKKYSVIILDEAHERSVYTDILMGLLSRIVPLRHKYNDPLKLIIMSATLRIEDFTENKRLFKIPPPVLKIESRQFPVSVHFNRKTNPDYMREAFRKSCKIHTQLPDGGILIFVTGQQEVNSLVQKLRKAFPMKNKALLKTVLPENTNDEDDEEGDMNLESALKKVRRKKEIVLPKIDLDCYDVAPNDDTEGDLHDDSDADSGEEFEEDMIHANAQPMWVLPLYSIMPTSKQAKVFDPPPEGCRLCVVATNVAETSLTIPGIKYVVDSGKVKSKLYDKTTGVTGFSVVWTSKASADQRAGRSGRTGPGHCYRLFSSAVFNDSFEDWSVPEMQRRPVDDLLLQMKSLGIQRVVNFPFPSPPDDEQLKTAERLLRLLGALEQPVINNKSKAKDDFSSKLTPLGESMSKFPVAPRFAKMLCLSNQHNLLEYAVALVASMSVQEVLLNEPQVAEGSKAAGNARRSWFRGAQGNTLLLGDAMVLLRAIGAAEYSNSMGKLEGFCNENHLRLKAVLEVRKIRLQLTNEINLLNQDLNLIVNPKMTPPDDTQARLLRQVLLSGFVDQVALKVDESTEGGISVQKKRKPHYRTPLLEDPVRLHSSSVLYKETPQWIIYQELYELNEKMFLRGVSAIEPEWLPIFASSLCNMSEPMDDPPPRFDKDSGTVVCRLSGTFGRSGWELPLVEMEYPEGTDRLKWFSMFILDGTIFPQLRQFKQHLLSTPQTMVKSWAKLQTRTEFFLKSLLSKNVDNLSKLLDVWKSEPSFLLLAFQKWIPNKMHNEVAVVWPPTPYYGENDD